MACNLQIPSQQISLGDNINSQHYIQKISFESIGRGRQKQFLFAKGENHWMYLPASCTTLQTHRTVQAVQSYSKQNIRMIKKNPTCIQPPKKAAAIKGSKGSNMDLEKNKPFQTNAQALPNLENKKREALDFAHASGNIIQLCSLHLLI